MIIIVGVALFSDDRREELLMFQSSIRFPKFFFSLSLCRDSSLVVVCVHIKYNRF